MLAAARIASLHVYPVKGCRGIDRTRSDVLASGLRDDRRFMILDADGGFVTQRERPELALVTTSIHGDRLAIGTPRGDSCTLPLDASGLGPPTRAIVWRDEVDCIDVVDSEAARMIGDFLGASVRLVFMPNDVVRQVDLAFANEGDRVGFADGYPVLFAWQASLDAIVANMERPVPMNRFRPNVVVSGGTAWEEETYAGLVAGALPFRTPKRCARCQVTLVDQATAATGKEPLRTLAKLRPTDDNCVYFAMNAIPDREGELAVGDGVRFATRASRRRARADRG